MTTTPGDDDPRLSSGAYSLDAVTPEEAAAFEKAADASETLREEADGLVETAGLLGLAATPVTPPDRMKADLMAKLAMTPQLPRREPVETPAAGPDETAPIVADAPAPASVDPAFAAPQAAATTAATPATTKATVRWFNRPAVLVAGIAAAAALFIGGGVVGTAVSGGFAPAVVSDTSAAGLAQITAAEDSQRSTVPVEGGGSATIVWSNSLGRSAVVVDGLTPLPDDKVYEAWYIDAEGAAPAGTFTAADEATSWHVLSGAMSPGDTIGVTVEPAGGSPAPTTTPILVAPTV